MFKSCDYCRHRKKKCVLSPELARCFDCEHLDLPCEFSIRRPSIKRQEKSRQIAARLRLTGAVSKLTETKDTCSDGSGSSDNGIGQASLTDVANLKEGDCQLRLAGRPDMANKRLFQSREKIVDDEASHLTMSGQYWRDVNPFWPFIPSTMLDMAESGRDPDLRRCIDLACLLSLNSMSERKDISPDAEVLVSVLQKGRLSMSVVAGALLLCPFVHLDDALVQRVFDSFTQELAETAAPIPPPIVAGTLLTNVWRRLAGHSHQPLQLSANVLQSYAQALDPTTFGHHYLRLSSHAAELDQRCIAMGVDGMQPDTARVWSKLEYECLLWQVCLPPSLLDTRDDLPATPESVVIHCLSSLLLLSFYSHVLEYADTLGALIALRPVPGVLLFMCALARSTFICPRKLLDRMPLLVSIQAQTSRIMLRVWHQTGFENCQAILNLWENPGNRFPDLARQVRQEIGPGPWAIEEIDGYSVFWTFRDLRTLTTKFIFAGQS